MNWLWQRQLKVAKALFRRYSVVLESNILRANATFTTSLALAKLPDAFLLSLFSRFNSFN